MSLETWKAEFYPTEASECSEADALEHSIRKWAGLSGGNLAKHGVALISGTVFEPGKFEVGHRLAINATSCALCVHFIDAKTNCQRCPLSIANGFSCDSYRSGDRSIFINFINTDDPRPMQEALAAAKEWTRRESK